MRVAIIGDYPLNTQRIWGGEQAAFAYLVRGLCEIDGLDVHVLTVSKSASEGEVREEPSGATVHVLPALPRWELFRRYPVYGARLNEKLGEIRPDVVHAQGAIHHGFVALRSPYPSVITVHGVQSEDCKYQRGVYLRLRKRFVSWWLEQYNLQHTRYLIAISRYVTRYFSRLLRPDVDIAHIPNAIDGRFFELSGRADGTRVLYAGRVIQRKRVLDLVKAFAELDPSSTGATLRIAGETHTEAAYADEIRELVRKKALQDRILFLGPLEEEAILQEFADCDLLALPSAQETTPMVIAQAMAAAKPVVATPVGGVSEMVRDGETGYLHGLGDVLALADAMRKLLGDASLRHRMGKAGKDFAIENYRADNVARRTLEVYQRMVQGRAAS